MVCTVAVTFPVGRKPSLHAWNRQVAPCMQTYTKGQTLLSIITVSSPEISTHKIWIMLRWQDLHMCNSSRKLKDCTIVHHTWKQRHKRLWNQCWTDETKHWSQQQNPDRWWERGGGTESIPGNIKWSVIMNMIHTEMKVNPTRLTSLSIAWPFQQQRCIL